jgi:uridine kinase
MQNRPVLIGISGGTGSGKTTVAQSIYDRVGSDRIEWISHDSYYRDFGPIDPESRHAINFDHPDSLESDLLVQHLDVLRNNQEVEIPIYDFKTHLRSTGKRTIRPRKVIIVEGILVLAEPEIRKRIDIKLFVDTPPDIRFLRRLTRDVQKRGRSLDSVVQQYLRTVRPMHEEFVEPSKRYADLIIPEGGENQVALDAIIARVEHLLS